VTLEEENSAAEDTKDPEDAKDGKDPDKRTVRGLNDYARAWALVGLEIYRWSLDQPQLAENLLTTTHQWYWDLLVISQDELVSSDNERARLDQVSANLDRYQHGIRDHSWWTNAGQASRHLLGTPKASVRGGELQNQLTAQKKTLAHDYKNSRRRGRSA
jgi:hypothetical protein